MSINYKPSTDDAKKDEHSEDMRSFEEASYNEAFSKIYDRALNILPYDKMADFLEKVFMQNAFNPSSLLELGCGTGSLAILMKERGYGITGLDLSTDMLCQARQKCDEKGIEIPLITQSMSELELIDTYDVIYSFGDALNYLTDERDLLKAFEGAYKYLNTGGYFIFDVNTIDKFKSFGNNIFTESEDDFFYIWENEYIEDERLNYYYVEIFSKTDKKELYERSFETHIERGYEHSEILSLLNLAGFKEIKTYTDLYFTKGIKSADRLFFVCQ